MNWMILSKEKKRPNLSNSSLWAFWISSILDNGWYDCDSNVLYYSIAELTYCAFSICMTQTVPSRQEMAIFCPRGLILTLLTGWLSFTACSHFSTSTWDSRISWLKISLNKLLTCMRDNFCSAVHCSREISLCRSTTTVKLLPNEKAIKLYSWFMSEAKKFHGNITY